MAKKRIGFLGAYSIDNAGDVLVGYATRQALRRLLPDCEQVVYAPEFPEPFWRHAFGRDRGIDAPIAPVPAGTDLGAIFRDGLSALVIGGGGIISIEPSFRPFLLGEPSRFPADLPAAWNGVCSQNQPHYLAGCDEDYAAVRACCERLRYVSVRNRSTWRFLRHCGFSGEINIVPDPAILLDAEDGFGQSHAELDAILDESGVRRDRLLIGVSVGQALCDPRAAGFFDDLFAALERFRHAAPVPCELVLFPFGAIYSDEELQRQAARRMPSAKVLSRPLDPLGCFRFIGRLGLYVCTRFHAMLAAFCQNVPFLVLDEYLSDVAATSKIREFISDGGLEAYYLCPFLSKKPAWKLEGILASLPEISFATGIAECKHLLFDHYARMIGALGLR